MKNNIKKIYTANSDYQYLLAILNNRKKRHKADEFLVEGVLPINSAIKSGWKINSFIYSKDKKLSNWAKHLLNSTDTKENIETTNQLIEELSQKEETSELLALAKIPSDDFNRIKINKKPLLLVLDRPTNPGNLGSIIRSANSFGIDGIIVTGHATDIYSPTTISASRGAIFLTPVIRKESFKDILEYSGKLKTKHNDLQIIGTDEKADIPLFNSKLDKPTILVMGNEALGLSKSYLEICDQLVKIPMFGSTTSLNLACSTSIFLYEIIRQRTNLD